MSRYGQSKFISDAALEGVIKAVRRAVGDSGRTQWCIQTRRGQGYRFVAPLVELIAAQPGEEAPAEPTVPDPPEIPPQEPAVALRTEDAPAPSRRQLTVMLCDLVDFPALAGQLDPEDLREVVLAYQQTCIEVVRRFDGHVAQLLGAALLVYFGWPVAHEDDAQRAVRTGLGFLAAMGGLTTRLERDMDLRLAIRVGIHTGLVVVGEMGGGGHQEQLAMGEAPNIAARLEGFTTGHFLKRLTQSQH